MNKVELRQAFEWTCDECGKDNFERGLMIHSSELTEEELAELQEMFGVEPGAEGTCLFAPENVKCQYCKSEFETEVVV